MEHNWAKTKNSHTMAPTTMSAPTLQLHCEDYEKINIVHTKHASELLQWYIKETHSNSSFVRRPWQPLTSNIRWWHLHLHWHRKSPPSACVQAKKLKLGLKFASTQYKKIQMKKNLTFLKKLQPLTIGWI